MVIVTKIDKVAKDRVAAQLVAVNELAGDHAAAIVPVSATTGEQVDVLIDVLVDKASARPAFYPDGELTDEPEEVLMAELIREAALEGVRRTSAFAGGGDRGGHPAKERESRDDLIDVHALIYVERPSQKGIVVIGKGGKAEEVGTTARRQIEKLLGTKVYLTCGSGRRTGSRSRNSSAARVLTGAAADATLTGAGTPGGVPHR